MGSFWDLMWVLMMCDDDGMAWGGSGGLGAHAVFLWPLGILL